MSLKVLPASNQLSSRSFLDYLIEKNLLKPGFRQVLGGKAVPEIRQYILQKQLVAPEALAEALAGFYSLPFIRLIGRPINPQVVKLLPREVIDRYEVLPFDLQGLNLSLAIADPTMLQRNAPGALTKLRQEKGLNIALSVVPFGDIEAVVKKVFSNSSAPIAASQPTPAVVTQPTAAPAVTPPPIAPPSRPEVLKKVEDRGKEIDLTTLKIAPEVLNKIPYAVAKKYRLIVFDYQQPHSKFEPPMIKVAAVHPEDLHVKEILTYIEQRNKVLVDRYHTSNDSFTAALGFYPEAKREQSKPEVQEEPEVVIDDKVEPTAPAPGDRQPTNEPEIRVKEELPQASPPVHETPTSPAASTPATNPPSGAEEAGAVVLTANDIINRPVQESAEELQRLASEQQASLEDQNLDKLLRQPVTSAQDLAKVFRSGVIPEIVAAMLFLAIRMKASDVHIEAEKEFVRVRYRIDGILHNILEVPAFLHAPLISRIKILSKMKIDEQRVPQDGRFDVVIDNRQVDLRVSTLPTVHGEKIVMRLLDKSEGMQTLEQLGVTGTNFDTLIENINKPYGIILSTGPTGSGKSTTLYSILSRISKPGINIITLEDPVEYELPGLNQAQVKPGIGFTFAEGLRSVLRQDPNVIMVGEIRDLETAAMATHAALTGHLVLSTLHTNDSAGALPRLIDMGVEPFLITSSINAVIGQRLVRKICDNCKRKAQIPPAVLHFVQKQLADISSGQLKNINLDQLVFYEGGGCSECTDGYKGRIGIFEVLAMTEEIENLAVKKVPASEIQKAAIRGGMITMIQDGLLKALKGITTIDEVMRVTTTSIKEVPGVES